MKAYDIAQRGGIIVLYLALNISINLLNKFIIAKTGFAFPLAVSLSHMVFSTLALGPWMLLHRDFRGLHAITLRKNALGVVVIGVSFSLNLALNNYSLTLISLSLNQMIRSSIPIVTVVCSALIDHEVPTSHELLSLGLLTFGVCTVLADNIKANAVGVVACVLSTIANGVMMSTSGLVLQEKLDVWRLSFYQAPIVIAALAPVYLYSEHGRVVAFLRTHEHARHTLTLILTTCVVALGYNAIHGIAIKMTSATTTTVIGQLKIILLIFLCAVILGERDFFSWRPVIGGMVAIAGFTMYSLERTRINERQKK